MVKTRAKDDANLPGDSTGFPGPPGGFMNEQFFGI